MRGIYKWIAVAMFTGNVCSAQIQVSEEPMHHKVFANEWVRILDVHVPPGDTSLWHKHSTPSVFLILSNTKTGSQVKIQSAKKPSFSDGNIWFEGFYDTPRIHRVWNEDDHEFHVMDIELPHLPYNTIDPPFTAASFHLLFDEKPVRGYRLSLAAGASFREKPRKAAIVVIRVDDGQPVKVQDKVLQKRGDYLFIPPATTLDFRNDGQTEGKLALFELK